MGLALKKYSNATIKFSRRGAVSQDDNYNMSSTNSFIDVPALLEAPKLTLAATNNQEADFVGHLLVETLPAGIKFPVTGKITFTNGMKGDVQVSSPPPNPYFKETAVLGIPVNVQWTDH